MLKQYSETMNKSMKPFKDLLNVNANAIEQLSQQQTELFTGLISDGLSYADSLTKQNEYKGWVNVNQTFSESVRTRMLKSVKESYAMFSASSEQATSMLKPAAPAKVVATPAVASKKPAAVKAAPKKPTAKPAAKPVAKTVAKPAAPAKAAEAKPAAAKPAVAAKPAAKKPAAAKPAAKKPAAAKKTAVATKPATKPKAVAKPKPAAVEAKTEEKVTTN